MKKSLIAVVFAFLLAMTAFAQEDAEGCKDHPLFNRMPNYYIEQCIQNFDLVDIVMETGDYGKVEGYKTMIVYQFNTESGQQPVSFYQAVKNYENALVKYGVKRIYLGSSDATLYFKANNKTVWVGIGAASDVAERLTLTIVEIEEMKQDIMAADIYGELDKSGHIALYINFETAKSVIKSESQNIIDQIAAMLTENPALKISIEGHTDNVGDATANQNLSVNRAQAVLNAIVAKGIDKSRLSAKGWGATKPIADNNTEEGKAKNRRVEIVKM